MGLHDGTTRGSTAVALARTACGAALLVAPRAVLRRVHGVGVDRPSLVVARVLGARQVAQGLVTVARPTVPVLVVGVGVDALHAASMLGLAAVDRGRSRGALTEAMIAGSLAGLGWATMPPVGP